MPESVMVDSGTFTQEKKGIIDVKSCLSAQLRMLEGWPQDKEAVLVHYDKPLCPDLPFDEYQSRVDQNIEAAREYIDLFPSRPNLSPLAVIHALDGETLASSYLELYSLGYRRFAIGSLVALIYRARSRLKEVLAMCRDLPLPDLHVLGISSPALIGGKLGAWIGSFDTSAPVRQAIGGTVFYSQPFERFVIRPTGLQKHGKRAYGHRGVLDDPRPCDCPACAHDPQVLAGSNESAVRQFRKVHNVFHLLREVKSWGV
jgi:tRNA-guanine family transglycosylase